MSCAYYGVSAGLTIGYATLFYAWSRRLWTSRPVLDRDRHRRGVVARHRGAVLPALPADPGRDRLRAIARRCAAVVGVRAVVPRVGSARARLDAAAHPRLERGRALSRLPLDRPRTRRRRDRASRAERPPPHAAAFPRPRNGDALWLDRDPDVLGVARSASRPLQRSSTPPFRSFRSCARPSAWASSSCCASPCSRRLPSASSAGAFRPAGAPSPSSRARAAILELNDLPFDWRSDSVRSDSIVCWPRCRADRWPSSRSSTAESIFTSTRATCSIRPRIGSRC